MNAPRSLTALPELPSCALKVSDSPAVIARYDSFSRSGNCSLRLAHMGLVSQRNSVCWVDKSNPHNTVMSCRFPAAGANTRHYKPTPTHPSASCFTISSMSMHTWMCFPGRDRG